MRTEPEHPAASPPPVRSGRPSCVFASVVLALRFLIVPALVVAAFAAWRYLPGVSSLPESGAGALLPANTPAARAEADADTLFGSALLPRIAVVQRNPRGLPLRQQRKIVARALRLDRNQLPGFPRGSRALPYVNSLRLVPGAEEKGTTAITYLGFPTDLSPRQQRDLADDYARAVSLPGATAQSTGFIPGSTAQADVITKDLGLVEIASVLVVALIIALYLRSLLAPLVTLGAAAVAYVVAIGAVSWIGRTQGVQVQSQVEPIVVVLLLGVVTDYSVFFLSGMRGRLRAGEGPREAARNGTAEVAPIIFTAGLLVAASLATLRLASIGYVSALGPAMAVVVLVSLGVSMTLVPAAMGILGRALFWPGLREAGRRDPLLTRAGGGIRRGVARATSRRLLAVPAILLAAVPLVLASTGLASLRLALTPITALADDTGPAQAAEQAERGFTGGMIAPTEIVLRAPGVASRPAELRRLTRGLSARPEVGAVIGPGIVPLPRQARLVFRTRAGDAARWFVAFRSHPYSSAGSDDLAALQKAMPGLVRAAGLGGARVQYAGDTALTRETIERTHRDLLWIGAAAIAVNLLLLAVFLRSLVAPLLMVASSLLGIAATFGVTALVFRDLLDTPDLTYFVPLAVGVLLLAFGTDYNLFVVGRIWHASRGQGMREAIRDAVPGAGRTISIAGLALALSFATLAIVPLDVFRELAFATSLGVLVDTFVVRTLLIPALLAACGDASWWPSRRRHSSPGSGKSPEWRGSASPGLARSTPTARER